MQLFFRFVIAMIAGVVLAQPGVAGGWSLDHYKISRNSPGETHTDKLTYITVYDGTRRGYQLAEEVRSAQAGSYGIIKYPQHSVQEGRYPATTGSALGYVGSGSRDHTSPPNQLSPGVAQAVMTVTPVFKWISNGDNDLPSEEFWIWEKSDVHLSYSHGMNPETHLGQTPYTAENPYRGQKFLVGGINLGLDGKSPLWSRSYPLSSGGVTSYNYLEDNATQAHPKLMRSMGRSEINGQTRTLRASVKSQGWDAADLGSAAYGSGSSAAAYVSLSYQAEVVQFSLDVSAPIIQWLNTHPRDKELDAYASRVYQSTEVPIHFDWRGSATYTANLTQELLGKIGTPEYLWNSSGKWSGLPDTLSDETQQQTIGRDYKFGTDKAFGDPQSTNLKLIVRGDNAETGVLTAKAKINWYEAPTTSYQMRIEIVAINLETGEEVDLTGNTANDGSIEGELEAAFAAKARAVASIQDVTRIVRITSGGLITITLPDTLQGRTYRADNDSALLGEVSANLWNNLNEKQTVDSLIGTARARFNVSNEGNVALRVTRTTLITRRFGKMPPGFVRNATVTGVLSTEVRYLGGACFVKGTLVSTENGLRAIETLKKGELVWSRDESSGETQLKPIKQTFEKYATTLALTFSNGETIETTREHPFYVVGRGFVKAGELGIGSSIVTRAGPSVQVVSVEAGDAQTVYNFEVADFHTYFVGQGEVWVHNSCYKWLDPSTLTNEQDQAIIDVLTRIKNNGGQPHWFRPGMHWGDPYGNNYQGLPIPGTNPKIYELDPQAFPYGTNPRGQGRIIVNDEGEMFFTDEHYQSFHEIDYDMFNVQ